MTLLHGIDFYKLTMSQVAFERHRDAVVTFTLHNRGRNRLSDVLTVSAVQERLDAMRDLLILTADQKKWLRDLKDSNGEPRFTDTFLMHLRVGQLPTVRVHLDEHGEIAVSTSGPWWIVTLWETVVMSELNELYYNSLLSDPARNIACKAGRDRIELKVKKLLNNPDIKIIEFGTRRRFSRGWHRGILRSLKDSCPNNLLGTSNVGFAHELGLKPIGTFAHEMPMVYAALADQYNWADDLHSIKPDGNLLIGHGIMLSDWYGRYGSDLSIALTDTFTSEYFFKTFGPIRARQWNGLRHDSGDPFEFGERAIDFYRNHGIDPTTKSIVFSDSLNIDLIERLHKTFKGRIQTTFGWGTDLTNDLGLTSNNFVMKATEVNGVPTVKLSDDPIKHTGPQSQVERYQRFVRQAMEGN